LGKNSKPYSLRKTARSEKIRFVTVTDENPNKLLIEKDALFKRKATTAVVKTLLDCI